MDFSFADQWTVARSLALAIAAVLFLAGVLAGSFLFSKTCVAPTISNSSAAADGLAQSIVPVVGKTYSMSLTDEEMIKFASPDGNLNLEMLRAYVVSSTSVTKN